MDAITELHASENLEKLRSFGDAAADAAVAEIVRVDAGPDAGPRKWFGTLARMAAAGPDADTREKYGDAYASAHEFLWAWTEDDQIRLNDLIDPTKVRRTQKFFETYGLEISSALLHYSLCDAYACARGAQVLYLAGEFISDPARRVRETAQLLIKMMAPDHDPAKHLKNATIVAPAFSTTLHAGQTGAVTGRQIRLFHALIRAMMQKDSGYPVADRWEAREAIYKVAGRPERGVAICQEDQLGTLFSFSVSVFEALPKLGVRYDDRDAEAWFHVWDIIGRHLGVGVESALGDGTGSQVDRKTAWEFGNHITGDLAIELMGVIRNRHREPSHEGKILANALLREIEGPLPRSLKSVPAAMVQYLGGSELIDLLGIRCGGWGQYWLTKVAENRPIARVVDRFAPLRMPGGELAALVTREVLQMFVEQGNFKIDLPGSDSRGLADFELNDRLKRSWGIHNAERPTRPPASPLQLTPS